MANTPDQLMQSLLNKLYSIITGGIEGMPVDTDNYVSWITPGIPFKDDFFNFASIPPAMALPSAPPPPGGTTLEQQKGALAWRYTSCANQWAEMANFVPSGKPLLMTSNFRQAVYHTSQERLWNVFDDTLRMSQVATIHLTDDEKAKVEKFRNLLSVSKTKTDLITGESKVVTEDGPVLVAYKQYQKAYLAASLTYKNAQIAFNNAESADAVNRWQFMGTDLRTAVDSAMGDWIANGYKNEVEEMQAYIAQVTARDMATIKMNISNAFSAGLEMGPDGRFYHTSVIPADFTTTEGWTGFEFAEGSVATYAHAESTAWNAGGGFGFGLWSAGANVNSTTATTDASFNSSNSSVKFEVVQIPIARGWFEPGFLIGKGWKWSADYNGDDLSDGNLPPSGRLVAYPTMALFVRKVVINNESFSSNRHTYEHHFETGGSFGWGPFSANFHYSHDEHEDRSSWHFESDGLHIDGLQLIGFICRFVGKSPDPSPAAHFDA